MTSGRQVRNSRGLHLLVWVMPDEGKNGADDQYQGVANQQSEQGELGPVGEDFRYQMFRYLRFGSSRMERINILTPLRTESVGVASPKLVQFCLAARGNKIRNQSLNLCIISNLLYAGGGAVPVKPSFLSSNEFRGYSRF